MPRNHAARIAVQCIVTIGLLLTLLLAGAAPVNFPINAPTATELTP